MFIILEIVNFLLKKISNKILLISGIVNDVNI